jgi:hypothetical protein
MHARFRLSVACAAALLGAAAQAQSHLKPGLWEETVTSKTDNEQANAAMAQMKQRLAAMSPEQRAAMEKMMGGHALPGSGAPNVIRVCITKEQAERNFAPDQNGRCTRTNVSTSGNTTQFDFSCVSPHSTISGHGAFTNLGDSAFAVSSAADAAGTRMKMHVQSDIAGKFVSSDCGDVKPYVAPPAK